MTQPSATPADLPTPPRGSGIIPDYLYPKLTGKLSGLSGIDKLTGTIGAFFTVITNPAMWRSVGWFLLGGVLFVIGVLWLVKDNAAFTKVGAKVKAAAADSGGDGE